MKECVKNAFIRLWYRVFDCDATGEDRGRFTKLGDWATNRYGSFVVSSWEENL